jgi:hypothetical protein
MSSTQENLLFKITVEQTGLTSPQIDQMAKSIQNLGGVLKGIGGGGSSGLGASLENLNANMKELNASVTQLNTNMSKIGTGAATTGFNRVKQSVQQTTVTLLESGRAVDSFNASMQKIQSTGDPFQRLNASAKTGAGTMETFNATLNTVKNTTAQTTTSTNTLGESLNRLSQVGTSAQRSTTAASEATMMYGRQMDSAAASTTRLGQNANTTSQNINKLTNAEELNNTANSAGLGYDKERAAQWLNNIRHISGTALSFMSLYQAMDSVQGIGEMVSLQQEKVTAAQEKYNQAVAQFGPDSKQAIQAHDQLAKAMRGLSYEQREANFAMHNMLFMVGLVVIELTNSLLPIIIKANAAMKEMGGIGGVVAAGFQRLTQGVVSSVPSFNMFTLGGLKARKAAKLMAEEMVGAAPKIEYSGKGLKFAGEKAAAAAPDIEKIGIRALEAGAGLQMGGEGAGLLARAASSLLGPVAGTAVGLAIAATAALLYGNNVLGARDALNGIGVEAGKANPVLGLIGNTLVTVAAGFGLTGESAERSRQHVADLDKSYQTVATIWNNVVAGMQASDNKLVQSVGNMVHAMDQSFVQMGDHFRNQVGLSVKTWGEFTNALEQHDYKKAVDIIGQAFAALPGIINTIIQDVGGLLINFGKGLIDTFGPAIKGTWDAIVGITIETGNRLAGLLVETGKRMVTGLMGQLSGIGNQITTWVDTSIVKPINNFVNLISVTAADIWKKIVSGAGAVEGAISSWVKGIADQINKFIDQVSITAADIWNKIVSTGGAIGDMITSWVTKNITDPINNFVANVNVTATAIWQKIAAAGGSILSTVQNWVTTNITDPVNNFVAGVNVTVDAIWKKIVAAGGSIASTVQDWITKNITDPVNNFITGINVTADAIWKKIVSAGGNIQGLVNSWIGQYIVAPVNQLYTQVEDQAGKIIDAILKSDVGAKITAWVGGVLAKIAEPLKDPIGSIQKSIGGLFGGPQTANAAKPPTSGEIPIQESTPKFGPEKPSYATGGASGLVYKNGKWVQPETTGMRPPATGGYLPQAYSPFGGQGGRPEAYNDSGLLLGRGAGGYSNAAYGDAILPQSGPIQHVKNLHGGPPPLPPEEMQYVKSPEEVTGVTQGRAALGMGSNEPAPSAMVREGQFKGMVTAQPQADPNTPLSTPGAQAAPKAETLEDIAKRNDAYKSLGDEVTKLQTSYTGYNEILNKSSLAAKLTEKGTLEQQTAYQGMQADLVTSIASNKEYAAQLVDGGIKEVAFAQGVEDTKTKIYDQEVAISSAMGAHKEMAAEMAKGIPQNQAYRQGIEDQTGALQDQQISTANTAGKISQLRAQMKDTTAQTAAYGQGFVEGTLALDQQQVSLDQTKGSLDAFSQGIASGQVANNSFNEGINNNRDALQKQYAALYESGGELTHFNEALKSGEPQIIAWQQGILDQATATAKLVTETANLKGKAQELFNELGNTAAAATENSHAFAEAGLAAAEWGKDLMTADASQAGMTQGLQEVAAKLGVSTDGFIGNTEELKTWIGVMGGVKTVIAEVEDSLYKGGIQMMSKFTEAIANGGKGAKDALHDIEDEIGVKFPSEIKDAMEKTALEQTLGDKLQKMIQAGEATVNNADPAAYSKYIDMVQTVFLNGIAEFDGEVPPALEAPITKIQDLLSQPVPTTAAGMAERLAAISTAAKGIPSAANPAVAALDPLTTMTFSEQPQPTYDALLKSLQNKAPLTQAQQNLLAVGSAAGTLPPNVKAAAIAAGALNTSLTGTTTTTGGLSPALIQAAKSSDATTQGFVRTAQQAAILDQGLIEMATISLKAIAAGFLALPGQIAPAFVGILQQAGVMNTTLLQITATTLPAIAAAFQTLPPLIQPVFSAIIQEASTFFSTLTSMVAPNVTLIITAIQPLIAAFKLVFDTITKNIQTTFQQWVQATQTVVKQITQAIQSLIGAFNDTFKRAVEDAAGYLIQLQQANDKTFQNITKAVQQVVGAFNDNFKRAADDASGYLKQLGQIADQVMQQIIQKAQQAAQGLDKIGQSAKSAAGQVSALRSEINSLQDKTVTITIVTRRVTVFADEGMAPTVFMAAGGQQKAESNIYGDKPETKNSRVIVGESGNELVIRNGLTSKKSDTEIVKHMKILNDLGQKEPEMLTVIPLEGTNAMMFKNKHPELYAAGVYNAGSYPPYQQTSPSLQQQQQQPNPSTYSQMVYGRLVKDKHGNVTLNGRLVFRAGEALDIDAYEGRHISHGSHGDPKDRSHFQNIAGSNEDIKHNGVPFTFGDLTGFSVQPGMTTGVGKPRGFGVGKSGAGGGVSALGGALDDVEGIDYDKIAPASTDRLQASQRVYNDYISERVAAARDRPRTQQQDAVNGMVDNQADPSQIEYNEGANTQPQLDSVPPRLLPHQRQGPTTPQRSYEDDYVGFMQKLISEITKKVDGKIRINLHSQVDTRIWGKITNQQMLNDMVRS